MGTCVAKNTYTVYIYRDMNYARCGGKFIQKKYFINRFKKRRIVTLLWQKGRVTNGLSAKPLYYLPNEKMPLINPDEIIKTNFKILSKRKKSPGPETESSDQQRGNNYSSNNAQQQQQPDPVPTVPFRTVKLEEILVSTGSSSDSMFTKRSEETRSFSRGDESLGKVSAFMLEEAKKTITAVNEMPVTSHVVYGDGDDTDKDGPKAMSTGDILPPVEVSTAEKPKEQQPFFRRKLFDDDDRRRNSWIPCTCPQYKVSRELASKWDLQGIFFGKIMVVKVVELLFINLVILASVFESAGILDFFLQSHDWVYLAYGIFLALLLCIRWGVGYRSRWPTTISIILMVPLTAIIGFTSACVAVIYNSMLIPLVTCTIFLSFVMICFVPYFLRKSVMHRTTNLAGACLTLLSSIILLFLKEFEVKPMTYWNFVSHVWLPGLLLSQIAVQITIFEIQRIIFGLCFNVSTKRWHIAALYI